MTDNKNTTEVEVEAKVQEAQVVDEHKQDENDVETQVVEVVNENKEEEVTEDSQVEDEVTTDSDQTEDDESQDDEESEADKEALAAIKKVRNEAKNLRKRLKEAEATIADLSSKTDSAIAEERDALRKELDEIKDQIQKDKIIGEIENQAMKMSAIEPQAVARLVDTKLVKFDDDGKPTNIKELLTDTRNQFKRLFGATGSGNTGSRDERGSSLEGVDSQSLLSKGFKSHDD